MAGAEPPNSRLGILHDAQFQQRMTDQICQFLDQRLRPAWAMVVVQGRPGTNHIGPTRRVTQPAGGSR